MAGQDGHSTGARDQGAFQLQINQRIAGVLKQGAESLSLPQDLSEQCAQLQSAQAVPWKLLHRLCQQLRDTAPPDAVGASLGPWMHEVCAGAVMHLPAPPARREARRSKQQSEHLARLQDALDNRRYADMVADITVEERRAEEMRGALFPTARLQLSFGLHVLVTMGAFFALGFYGGRFYFEDHVWGAVLGVLALAFAMVMETVLLIIRTNRPEPLETKYAHLLQPQWQSHQQQLGSDAAQRGGLQPKPARQKKRE